MRTAMHALRRIAGRAVELGNLGQSARPKGRNWLAVEHLQY
jgi:hypothetical protein